MVGAFAERDVPDVTDHDVLGQLGATVEDDVLPGPPVQLLDGAQKLNRIAYVRYPLDRLDVEGFVPRPQSLVDLLQSQQACTGE